MEDDDDDRPYCVTQTWALYLSLERQLQGGSRSAAAVLHLVRKTCFGCGDDVVIGTPAAEVGLCPTCATTQPWRRN